MIRVSDSSERFGDKVLELLDVLVPGINNEFLFDDDAESIGYPVFPMYRVLALVRSVDQRR